MLPDYHTFFSDPHIGDPLQWLAGGEDPMLFNEAEEFRFRRKNLERIQLVAGVFLLLAVLAFTTPKVPVTGYKITPASLAEAVKGKPPENPTPKIPPPALKAQAYSVRFFGFPSPLIAQRGGKPVPPASLTKLLTAVAAVETLLPDAVITISKNAKTVGEKMSKNPAGERFRRDDAIRIMLVESANDAAWALAEAVLQKKTPNPSGSIAHFSNIMNETAVNIGMRNSRFKNPTGLDEDGHVVTAEDFSRLMEYILQRHPELWEMTSVPSAEVISLENRLYAMQNTNELLREFPAIQGGKTGLTDKAKGALFLLYPVPPSYTALIVILGSEDRFEDGRKIIHWLEEAF